VPILRPGLIEFGPFACPEAALGCLDACPLGCWVTAALRLPDLTRASGQAPLGILSGGTFPTSGKGNKVKFLVSTCAPTTSFVISAYFVVAVFALHELAKIALAAIAVFTCKKKERSETAVTLLRILVDRRRNR
jgi:hypothetical protein